MKKLLLLGLFALIAGGCDSSSSPLSDHEPIVPNQNLPIVITTIQDMEALAEGAEYLSNGLFKMAGYQSFINDKLYECGEFRAYGCAVAISGDGTRYWMFNYGETLLDTAMIYWPDGGYGVASIGSDHGSGEITVSFQGFGMYRWAFGQGHVLVDSCDNPTRQYVKGGERAETRLALDNGIVYTVGALVGTKSVSGKTLGRIRFSTGADRDDTAFCEMVTIFPDVIFAAGVGDVTGLYDEYDLEVRFDGNAPSLQGPWTFE